MLVIDPRLEQVGKIYGALFNRGYYDNNCMLTNDNRLIIILDNTLIYEIPLTHIDLYPRFGFNYLNFVLQREAMGEKVDTSSPAENNATIDYNTTAFDIADNIIFNTIESTYSFYDSICKTSIPLFSNQDMRAVPEFEELVKLKATDGMKYYKALSNDLTRTFMIPMFSGMFSLSTPDKLAMNIYAIDDRFSLVECNIYKKKINRNVRVMYRILNII